jgi:tetratricopeptide (TPR) repeat protein
LLYHPCKAQTVSVVSKTDSLLAEANIAYKNKDYTSALYFGEKALLISQSLDYTTGSKNALLLLARIHKGQNKFTQTLDYYFQLLSEISKSNDETLKALVNYEIGSLYFDSGIYEKSLEYFLKSDTMELNSYGQNYHTKRIQSIAYAYDKINKYDKSMEYYHKLLPYLKDDFEKKQLAVVLGLLSDICKKNNRYKEASNYELQNLRIWKELRDTSRIAVSLNNLGAIHKNLGDNEKALKYFLESYELKKASGDNLGLAITCLNIGIMNQLIDNYDESLKYLFRALTIQKKLGNTRDLAHSCNLIAAVYYYKKNYLKAETYSLDAVNYSQNSKANDLLETSYKLLSQIYKIQGYNDKALEYYQFSSNVKDTISLRQKIQQQELYLKYLSMETKEAQIKDLQIEKELKELALKKLELENENRDRDLMLFKREKDLQEISLQQRQLQQEKAINLLMIKEQKYRADASEKELIFLKQSQLLEDKDKQSKIQALNNQAEINSLKLSKKEADFRVQKIWQFLIVSIFIITLVIIILIFNRYKLKQKASQSKLISKNLEIEQKFLRAQMNPHFMFNALNSIQSFVTLNDTYSAERYLAKFSRLMRYILDNTSQPYISIETEVKTLQLYLELEQLRFDFKFDFQITVSDEIDDEVVVIPPMLTQPFVENAIIHGIMHKKDKGNISVKFFKNNDSIIATIVDDGVGRDEAFRIKKRSDAGHKSMGMQVTKDRLALLNDIHGSNFNATIFDLMNTDGKSLGTKVDLRILYMEI